MISMTNTYTDTAVRESGLRQAEALLSGRLAAAVERIGGSEREQIQELRLRRGGYLSAGICGREYFVTRTGRLVSEAEGAVNVTESDIEFTCLAATDNSIHSFEREIRQGFVTAGGGCRVGFCGRAVCTGTELVSVKEISSVNIRISREVIGCAEGIYRELFAVGARSLLIAGPPASGKTTVLRDLCRLLSAERRVSLIDERGEIAAVCGGCAQNDVGLHTDVFTGYPKLEAIMTAVRVMSPEIVVCDEIGTEGELPAYEYAIGSGARLICTCHADTVKQLRHRPVVSQLTAERAFDAAVMLGSGRDIGRVMRLLTAEELLCSDCAAACC